MADAGRVLADDGPVRCSVVGSVATLTLDNPPLNVVFRGMTQSLGRLLEKIAEEPTVRALIVTGAGERAFCAGSDIAEFQQFLSPGRIVPEKLALQHEVFGRLAAFPKPTIAALNGLAFGGGLELAVCCDLLVADETARFALPEIRLGLFPGSGGPVRVARRIGAGRAKEMMFLGEPVEASVALAWGLVDRVVPRGRALAEAQALGATLAQRAALALALGKQAVDLAFDADAIGRSLPLADRAFSSPEAREGVRAFLEKRAPVFNDGLSSEQLRSLEDHKP